MKYVLQDNVYLVNGKVKSCIYDFNNGKLYSINKNLAIELEKINNGMVSKDREYPFPDILDYLSNAGIIRLSDNMQQRDILELRDNNSKFEFAWIEVTDKCNLKCTHCYNESNEKTQGVMSFEDYKTVLDNLLNIGIKGIQIIGGEPFLYKKELKNFLNYTVDKVNLIEIFTNGTLVSNDWYQYLALHNIHIALSVYSYSDYMHDKVTCVKGSWKRTNDTIVKLIEYNIPYRVCNVLMNDIDIGDKNTEAYTLSEEKDVVRMSGRANFKLLSKSLIKKKLITKNTFRTPLKKEFCKRIISGHNCWNDRLYVSANLDVYPCVMERRIKHCTIKKNEIISINEQIRLLNKDKVEDCKHCEFRYCCFDCRPNCLSGNLYEKPWYCTYNPQTGEWIDEEEFIQKLFDMWQ